MVSRESSFLFNNLILLASCFAVLWGTMFPVLSEKFSTEKISLDAVWFNRLMVPIGLFLLFLTGVGPLFAWRRTSMESLRKNFQWPGIGMLVVVAALFIGGMRYPYSDHFARPLLLRDRDHRDGVFPRLERHQRKNEVGSASPR